MPITLQPDPEELYKVKALIPLSSCELKLSEKIKFTRRVLLDLAACALNSIIEHPYF